MARQINTDSWIAAYKARRTIRIGDTLQNGDRVIRRHSSQKWEVNGAACGPYEVNEELNLWILAGWNAAR